MAEDGSIRTAVVTGAHEYDVVSFQDMLRNLPGVNCYPQNLEDFVTDTGTARSRYEAVVFYNFHRQVPGSPGDKFGVRLESILEELLSRRVGLLILHHAIVAYPRWQLWSELRGVSGFDDVAGFDDQSLQVSVANPDHPIVSGLSSWQIVDETYVMGEPDPDNDVLLTVDHTGSLSAIAWTREVRETRVFCYQSGHDARAFEHFCFRTVLGRGIHWIARRL